MGTYDREAWVYTASLRERKMEQRPLTPTQGKILTGAIELALSSARTELQHKLETFSDWREEYAQKHYLNRKESIERQYDIWLDEVAVLRLKVEQLSTMRSRATKGLYVEVSDA